LAGLRSRGPTARRRRLGHQRIAGGLGAHYFGSRRVRSSVPGRTSAWPSPSGFGAVPARRGGALPRVEGGGRRPARVERGVGGAW
jgi:hypothetical protein